MPQVDAVSDNHIVVSNHARPGWHIYLAVGCVVLLLALGMGATVFYWHPWQVKVVTKSATKSRVSHSPAPGPTAAEQIASAQQLLQKADSATQKSDAYQQLGAAYMANGQTAQAIQAYQNAAANTSSSDTNSQVKILFAEGSAYYFEHQFSQEIAAMQQAITLLKNSSDPYAEAKIQYAQNIIDELQGAHLQ